MAADAQTPIAGAANVAAVAIGRNEGERLKRCLASMQGAFQRLVYVDSGSTDDSLEIGRASGAEIVELDLSKPFTAARARNAGFAALNAGGAPPKFVQFIDGDCTLESGWVAKGLEAMAQNPRLGIVTGWRSEIHRSTSVYNAICDFEWRRPAGPILCCGGDMIVRTKAFLEVGGFNDSVIAAEDDEFCVRVRAAGWDILRLPVEMTRHDAAMTRFGQWWRRAVRSGHGFAQVGALHPRYFLTERSRVWLYGLILPLIAVVGALWTTLAPLSVAALYALNYFRTALGLKRDGLPMHEALSHSVFLTLSKLPNLIGMLTFYMRRRKGRDMELIEYK
ncbi:MAG: glycosyltransferase [Hyphomicrobium sp.]